MTRISVQGFLIAVSLLLLAACGIEIPQDKASYVGDWAGAKMSLSISSEGQLDYKFQDGAINKSINAPLKAFEGDNFVAGVGPLETTFIVSQTPHQENGEWVMVVDGVRLVRQE